MSGGGEGLAAIQYVDADPVAAGQAVEHLADAHQSILDAAMAAHAQRRGWLAEVLAVQAEQIKLIRKRAMHDQMGSVI